MLLLGATANLSAFGVVRSFSDIGAFSGFGDVAVTCFSDNFFGGFTGICGGGPTVFVAVGTVTVFDSVYVVVAINDAGVFSGFGVVANGCPVIDRFGAGIGLSDAGPNFFGAFGTVTSLEGVGVVVSFNGVDDIGGVGDIGVMNVVSSASSVIKRFGAVTGLSSDSPNIFDAFGTVNGLDGVVVDVAFDDVNFTLGGSGGDSFGLIGA